MERVLIDTSVWIPFLNRPESPEKRELDRLIDEDRVQLAGIVIAELLQGIRKVRDRQILLSHLEAFPYEEMTREDWVEAGRLGQELGAKGHRIPLSDLAIAALCQRHHFALYSLDSHFLKVPRLLLHLPIPHIH